MAYELIETIEVGSGGAASIEFTSIPQDGVDLVLVASLRADIIGPNVELTFNNNSANYSHRTLRGLTPNVTSINGTGNTYFSLASNRSSDTANTFSNNALLVSNYAGSTNKSLSLDYVWEDNNTLAAQYIVAGQWADTSAITSLKLLHSSNFVQYSTASLYKIY